MCVLDLHPQLIARNLVSALAFGNGAIRSAGTLQLLAAPITRFLAITTFILLDFAHNSDCQMS
jgi:hypothetical protein